MNIDIQEIIEYHFLFGGQRKKNQVGNAFQALINHYFDNKLIFAIVESVNLNNSSIYGIGDTLFFTNKEGEHENQNIKDTYKAIIKQVEENFKHAIAEYHDWYNIDTILISVETGSTIHFNTETSGWRTRIFGNREEKGQKEKYGFIKFDEKGRQFKDYLKDYFQYYIDLLQANLSFSEFPYFVIIAKPIAIKDKSNIIKLGNLYLHFATTEIFDIQFYERLLNDFFLVWLREEGSIIINQIESEAQTKAKLETEIGINAHFPALWALKDSSHFSTSEIEKLNKPFGKSDKTIKEFYDEIFILNSFNCFKKLEQQEKEIIDELIPMLLKEKGWLKEGVSAGKVDSFIKNFKINVEHREFDRFDEKNVSKFTTLLSLRHIINICCCCFNYDMSTIHSFMVTGIIQKGDTSNSGFLNRLTSYFSKLFFYVPKGETKNIINFNKYDAYNSASFKERAFMKTCVNRISFLIKNEKKKEYNDSAHKHLQLESQSMKNFNPDNVSAFAVFDFKKNWCDENEIIPKLLKKKLNKYLIEPILDCGAGLGDIAYKAFPDKEAILLDINSIEDNGVNKSPLHSIVTKSFFDFFPKKRIKTLLISHTLQFIDSDINQLNKQIQYLNPETIIHISNLNDDIMGDLLKWTKDNYSVSNPEERIENFAKDYVIVDDLKFEATIKCSTFKELAKQISYLMMFDLSETGDQLENFLKTKLQKPEFSFNQIIEVFQKPKTII